ncbi:MAG: outer membrane lipoprotein-sorting protein [Deltaproteobacteria bacterium]|jgi:outer membrane lipoprotein-sorting protein|nr:outer membrane lipoprotein-sorting protein [Deltaproteobacteria bacterium]
MISSVGGRFCRTAPVLAAWMAAVLMMIILLPRELSAQAQSGRDIALRADRTDTSQTTSLTAAMTIRRGQQTLRRVMTIKRKKDPAEEKQLIIFQEPPDIRQTAYLTWSYKDVRQDDSMWVYLPAESLTRRISGGARKGAFMRSDFALEDIFRREVDEDEHTLLREEDLNGAKCYVLEAAPLFKTETSYTKRITWIRQDIYLPARVEYYGSGGKLLKVLVLGDYEKIQDIWVPKRQDMTASGQDSSTSLVLSGIVFDQPLAGDQFQSENLKR